MSRPVCRVLEVKSRHRLSYFGLVAAWARDDCQSEHLDPWGAILLVRFHRIFLDVQGVDRHWKVLRVSVEEHLLAFSGLSTETLSSCSQPMTALTSWL